MKDTINILKFIRRKRLRKKQTLYKLAFGVAFDWTIAIYTGFFLFMLLFILYDVLKSMEAILIAYQDMMQPFLPLVILGLLVGMLFRSFQFPGMLITSAEWKLTSLPYDLHKIWLSQFVRGLGKRFLLIFSIFFVLFLITPLTSGFLLQWYIFISLVSLLTLLPQWYFYQMDGFKKLFIYVIGIILVGIVRMIFLFLEEASLYIYVILLLLVCLNFWMWPRKLNQVNWMKVIEKSDEKEWNMFFINQMSRMDQVKKQPRNYFIQSLLKSKKATLPFPYHKPTLFIRKLWFRCIKQDMQGLNTTMFAVIACMAILSSRGALLQGIGVALSIFLFVQMMVSYFGEIFKERLIHSLPWNIYTLKKSYWFILIWLSMVVLVVITIALLIVNNLSWLLFVQLIFIYISLFFLLEQKLNERVHQLNEKWHVSSYTDQVIRIITYLSLAASFYYPIVITFLIVMIVYRIISKKYFPFLID